MKTFYLENVNALGILRRLDNNKTSKILWNSTEFEALQSSLELTEMKVFITWKLYLTFFSTELHISGHCLIFETEIANRCLVFFSPHGITFAFTLFPILRRSLCVTGTPVFNCLNRKISYFSRWCLSKRNILVFTACCTTRSCICFLHIHVSNFRNRPIRPFI